MERYIAKNDVRVVCGVTAFTKPKGTEITVTQKDKERSKVLIDFGGRSTDWFHVSFLDRNFDPI